MEQKDREELKRLLFDYRRYTITEDRVTAFVEKLLRQASPVPAGTPHGEIGQTVENQGPNHH